MLLQGAGALCACCLDSMHFIHQMRPAGPAPQRTDQAKKQKQQWIYTCFEQSEESSLETILRRGFEMEDEEVLEGIEIPARAWKILSGLRVEIWSGALSKTITEHFFQTRLPGRIRKRRSEKYPEYVWGCIRLPGRAARTRMLADSRCRGIWVLYGSSSPHPWLKLCRKRLADLRSVQK